jgi:hypothetical protein
MLGAGLALFGEQIANSELLRRPIMRRLDARIRQSDRGLAWVGRRRTRQETLERRLPRVTPVVAACDLLAIVGWSAVMVTHLAHLPTEACAAIVAVVFSRSLSALARGPAGFSFP